ncbi:lysophospholipid acyltransferase family protein [Candidatus Methylacidithermus pantelleriae]|uniref:1-acyl-sn-glycerol-3-phosphate acyltransferase n=1 Tax=Candidatus Methylacidithermus pantelleriae TaxID=2744239 RepID=A0A8J2BKM6_9BACT|nr:lysophospholipid acyltransferase family protein [Candidatus Methylacidithermus pantelleriae]CAF0693895.1 1-acyl-sn-glycerol-3-phosphate acyltransferase [Candidatus Methylacidithermus pantelleriae]
MGEDGPTQKVSLISALQPIWYRAAAIASGCLLQLGADIHWEGLEHIPERGGCLLVSNHISHFDPILLGALCSRPVDYMATEEFFRVPILRWILRSVYCFPVDRQRMDRQAVRTALERLRAGRMVGIFPEKGIRHGCQSILFDAKLPDSPVALAQLAAVPILPAAVVGSDQLYEPTAWLKRCRVFVAYGEPFYVGKREDRQKATWKLQLAIKSLFRELGRRYRIEEREYPRSAQERWAEVC